MKHLLSIEAMDAKSIETVLENAGVMKAQRGDSQHQPLAGKTWAMIFAKSSTRTRVSFEVGIRELGGSVMFLSANDLQLGRGEPLKDTARVLGRMVHGAVIRTYAQSDVEEFAEWSGIPTINALTDAEHPCQILTDIFTYQELRGPIAGKVVTYIGDGACNVPISWIWAAAKLNFKLRIAAPKAYQPSPDLIEKSGGNIVVTEDPNAAAEGADILYTDVWVSMGMETEAAQREQDFANYQINEPLIKRANADAVVMHCLPAHRGKEIDSNALETHAETIFTQAENRLHTQKAILNWLVN